MTGANPTGAPRKGFRVSNGLEPLGADPSEECETLPSPCEGGCEGGCELLVIGGYEPLAGSCEEGLPLFRNRRE